MLRVRRQIGCTDQLVESCGKKGVTVAMLDTGIALHPDFEDRIIGYKDFLNHSNRIYDDSGHGTHVAGCIAGCGRLSNGIYRGIAPCSRLLVGKVLDQEGNGTIINMLEGLQWVLEKREEYQIWILNISIGMGEIEDREKVRTLMRLLEEIWKAGILLVCAAGNMGPKPMTISPIGALHEVIAVGCHEGGYLGDKEYLCENYSGRGPSKYSMKKPDIVAPGTNIISCNRNFRKRGNHYYNGYIMKSGTSMATPIISGSLALLLQKYPYFTNEQAKNKLQHSTMDLGEPYYKQGSGMIQVGKLLE